MILLILSALFLILIGFYYFYFLPVFKIQKFAEQAKKAGYKVKTVPYQFMSFCWLKYASQDDRSLQVFKQELKNYDLIVGNMLTQLAVMAIHPNILKDLFNQSLKLHKNKFFSQIFQLLKGGGIAFAQGEQWKRKRRIISSAFHFDFLNDIIPTIEEQVDLELKEVDKQIEDDKNINLLKSFSKILSSVVVRCFFGSNIKNYKIQGKSFCEAYLELLDEMIIFAQSYEHMIFRMAFYNLGLSEKSRKLKEKIDIMSSIIKEITQKEIQKIKKKQEVNKNILTILYQNDFICQKDQINAQKYTVNQLLGQFYAFLAAGTDTTSNTLNLCLHYLSQYPQYVQKIGQELDAIEKKNFQETKEKLKNMKWIQAIFNETLRINGPTAQLIPRVAAANISAGGLSIPKGALITIYPILSQYKEQNFPNPFKFLPQRRLENYSPEPYTFIPFGAGQRNCIGQHLARIQTKILISRIVKKYKFKAIHPIKMRSQFIYKTTGEQFQMEIIQ